MNIIDFMKPQFIVLNKLIIYNIISNFIIIIINGIEWIIKDRNILDIDWLDGKISEMLWATLINIKMEKDAVDKDNKKIVSNIDIFHWFSLDIIITSLIILIDGGAEILKAIKMNHQNIIFGNRLINPLNEIIFRVWNFE